MKLWMWLKSNPYFVGTYSIFVAALSTQIQAAWQTGHPDWSLAGWEHMLAAAALFTLWTLTHLYTPTPAQAAALAAKIPPDRPKEKK
jgi:hypothetical protein